MNLFRIALERGIRNGWRRLRSLEIDETTLSSFDGQTQQRIYEQPLSIALITHVMRSFYKVQSLEQILSGHGAPLGNRGIHSQTILYAQLV